MLFRSQRGDRGRDLVVLRDRGRRAGLADVERRLDRLGADRGAQRGDRIARRRGRGGLRDMDRRAVLWTDDYSNLLPLLKL